MKTKRLVVSKGFKYTQGKLVNKMGSEFPHQWAVKKAKFSLYRVIQWAGGEMLNSHQINPRTPIKAIFRCRQTGELVTLKCKVE